MTTLDDLNARGQGYLPGLIGIEFLTLEPGRLTSRLQVRPELLAPNGYLHGHSPAQRRHHPGLERRTTGCPTGMLREDK